MNVFDVLDTIAITAVLLVAVWLAVEFVLACIAEWRWTAPRRPFTERDRARAYRERLR